MNSLFPNTETSAWMASLGPIALKGAGLLLLALVAGIALRRISASRRYVLWLSSLLAVGAVTIAAPLLPAWRVLPGGELPVMEMPLSMPAEPEDDSPTVEEQEAVRSEALVQSHTSDGTAFPASTDSSMFRWPQLSWSDVVAGLPLVWLAVMTLLIVRLVASGLRLNLLRRQCAKTEAPPELNDELSELAAASGKTAPKLLIGPAGSIPMVWGIVKPCLLLPADAIAWPEAKRCAVMQHELAHLRRRDPAGLLVAQLVQALHWFNPLAWLTVRWLRADQERACDDAVLLHGIRASEYAQHLLDISQGSRLAPGLNLCALAMARPAPVEGRVRAILDHRQPRGAVRQVFSSLVLLTAILSALPLAMLARAAASGLRGRIIDRNGVVLTDSSAKESRSYPLKTMAAHLIGYCGRTKPDDFTPEGRAGIEKQANGRLAAGRDVKLTLDARLQSRCIRAVQESGLQRGAVVVLDPRNGDVLASVSVPSYDPGRFWPSISLAHWQELVKDESRPLFDRSMTGQYAPGSAFMPLVALAGVTSGLSDRHYTCKGSVTYGRRELKCWISSRGESHGELDLENALLKSCNCFWYQFGNDVKPEHFESVASRIGVGERYGVMEGEAAGVFPSQRWLKEERPLERWAPGHVANLSIGQGYVLVTPLQMAVLAAAIANGGKVPAPRLIDPAAAPEWRADLVKDGADPKGIEHIREAMKLVVYGDAGTGESARSERCIIAGKTGTAQYWKSVDGKRVEDNRTWFVGFAPFEKPTLAFAVLMEGGTSGGRDCAPIAKRIVEEALALPPDGSGKVEPVVEREAKKQAGGDVKDENQKSAKTNLSPEASTKVSRASVPGSVPQPDDKLHAFLQKPVDGAAQFHVRIRRTHYFGDDIPGLAAKDGFEIEPAETTERPWYAGFVFVPKTSAQATTLVKSVPWETTGLQAEVTLKWRKADGKDWVELIEVNNVKHTDAAAPKVETRKERPILNDAPKLPNEATASETRTVEPATSSKNVLAIAGRRFRLIQGECGISDLPPDVKLLDSDLAGSISPREVVVRFSGPREAVRLWLAGCSGLRVPAAAAKPADPSLRILEANPLAVMDQWLKRPAIALSDWPSSGSTGRFECMGKSAMCSITVHAPDDDVVHVELRKQARSIKL